MVAVTDTNYALTPDQHSRELRRAVIAATVRNHDRVVRFAPVQHDGRPYWRSV